MVSLWYRIAARKFVAMLGDDDFMENVKFFNDIFVELNKLNLSLQVEHKTVEDALYGYLFFFASKCGLMYSYMISGDMIKVTKYFPSITCVTKVMVDFIFNLNENFKKELGSNACGWLYISV